MFQSGIVIFVFFSELFLKMNLVTDLNGYVSANYSSSKHKIVILLSDRRQYVLALEKLNK